MPDTPSGNPPASPGPTPANWRTTLPSELYWHAPPSGRDTYAYVSLNTVVRTFDEYAERWRVLVAWATQHNLSVYRYANGFYSPNGVVTNRAVGRLTLTEIVLVEDLSSLHPSMVGGVPLSLEVGACPQCETALVLGHPLCPGCGEPNICDRCGNYDGNLIQDGEEYLGNCCSRACDWITSNPDGSTSFCGVRSGYERCLDHAQGERAHCASCSRYTDDGAGMEYSDMYDSFVCRNCRPVFCDSCDNEFNARYLSDGLCENCGVAQASMRNNAANGTEEFEDEEKEERELFIQTIPGRENIRRCGIEIEGAGNYTSLGTALFSAGLTEHPSRGDYHGATSRGEENFWSLERDSSVDWELVSPPINLASQEHVRALRLALKVVRDEVKSGSVSLDMRCGLHIHVGAERTAIGGAYNLGTVWNYLEDLIFRLGAARWPKHRAIINGVHYCQPTQKGAKTRLEFGLQLDNSEEGRYGALSFQNYIRAMSRNCGCGAVRYDSWDQCVCDLGKCTFEFRVFNTSANMHKIHAYLALCQSLVAYATNLPDLDASLFPVQEFIPVMLDEMGGTVREVHVENWKPRLEFLFNQLPLTDPEKADLLYCVRSSELSALGGEFIDSLAPNNAQEVRI